MIYSIQQSLFQRREEDISRLVQNAKSTPTPEDTRLERLEQNMQKLLSRLEKQPQDMRPTPSQPLENNVAAYQPVLTQNPEAEQLAFLQQLRQLSSTNPGGQTSVHQSSPQVPPEDKLARLERLVMTHINGYPSNESTLAAYQPSQREHYSRDSAKDEEIKRLREENLQLKAAQRASQPQRDRSAAHYDSNRASQDGSGELSRALEEIRRMQSRMDGFMRAYASRNNRQDQPRVRTRDGRPICDICGRTGHMRQNCFSRDERRYPRQHSGQTNSRYPPQGL